MQRFLKTMASFLQKLFLTTSSGITFCSEVEEPRRSSQVGFLEHLLLEAEGRGGDCLKFPLNCRPRSQLCCSGSLKVLRTLFSIDNEFKRAAMGMTNKAVVF